VQGNQQPRSQGPHSSFLRNRDPGSEVGKSKNYRNVIVNENLRLQNVYRQHENAKLGFQKSPGSKSAFEKFRFRDRLM